MSTWTAGPPPVAGHPLPGRPPPPPGWGPPGSPPLYGPPGSPPPYGPPGPYGGWPPAAYPAAPRRRRWPVVVAVVGAVIAVLGVGAAVWLVGLRDELVTDLAIGTWSCTGPGPAARPVEAVIGDGTFAISELGYAGTWTLQDGRLRVTLTENPNTDEDRQVDFGSLPERSTPGGVSLVTSPQLSGSMPLQWSYQDGRIVLSSPDGKFRPSTTGAMEQIGACTKVR